MGRVYAPKSPTGRAIKRLLGSPVLGERPSAEDQRRWLLLGYEAEQAGFRLVIEPDGEVELVHRDGFRGSGALVVTAEAATAPAPPAAEPPQKDDAPLENEDLDSLSKSMFGG